MFVLDASVTLSYCLGEPEYQDQAREIILALKTKTAVVPAIWRLEVVSGLLKKERSKFLKPKEVEEILATWETLPVKTETCGLSSSLVEMLGLARKHNISVYDSSYLDLGMRLRIPIATFDNALRLAATKEGIGYFDGSSRVFVIKDITKT